MTISLIDTTDKITNLALADPGFKKDCEFACKKMVAFVRYSDLLHYSRADYFNISERIYPKA